MSAGPADEVASGHTRWSRALTVILFVIYGLGLIGLVLFKFPFRYDDSRGRVLNLIPLAGSFTKAGALRLSEIGDNILIFVPFGLYLGVLRDNWPFWKKLIPIVVTTVVFETIQYIFAIGRSDITDVLDNTLGGIIGIGLYALVRKALGQRASAVISVIALILTVCAVLLSAFLFLHSR